MKSIRIQTDIQPGTQNGAGSLSDSDMERRGSVLLVVIGMLGILLLAGIAFYTFASQENSSAEYYSDAAKVPPAPKMVADALFDFALEQLILGPDERFTLSALRGGRTEPGGAVGVQMPGRHSLLAGAIGHDGTFYNGEGIKLSDDPMNPGYPMVDMNQDGVADNPNYLNVNFSAGANGGVLPNISTLPGLDTGYTVPDINSPYLAYMGNAINDTTPFPTEYPVIKPSFHLPQLLRGGVATLTAGGNGTRLFRPHPDHLCKSGTRPRFLAVAIPHPTLAGHNVAGFPFTQNPNGTLISQGLWDLTVPPAGGELYNWDVDNDNDGVKEGIWLDLDHPVVELADGRRTVPMFSFTVVDADGLINLNASGNSYAWQPPAVAPYNPSGPPVSYPAGSTSYIHRSNMGITRSEINPMWGLYADASIDPGVNTTFFNNTGARDTALEQSRIFWNMQPGVYPSSTISYVHTANIEFLSLLNGRAQFVQAPAPTGTYGMGGNLFTPLRYLPGRRTGSAAAESNLLAGTIAPTGAALTVLANGSLPRPGQLGGDDDSDNTNPNGNNAAFYQMGHPIDYLGYGSTYRQEGSASAITQMLVGSVVDPLNPIRWPAYNNYEQMLSNVSYSTANGNTLFVNPQTSALNAMTDEEDESVAEPNVPAGISSNDSMFASSEMFGLHGSNGDFSAAATGSRLRDLAPFNFTDNNQAAAIRSQYTTLSMDRFQFGAGLNANRYANEVTADLDNDGAFEFPPVTLSTNGLNALEPIRLALRRWLTVEYGSAGRLNALVGFKLNMNQILDLDSVGNPFFRDLTSHPSGDPGAADIVAVAFNARFTSPAAQEYWARRDRQQLARDIYVLLYLLGGGNDLTAYATTSNSGNAIYSDQQLREMAQFAVNYVDAMDADRVMTKFEYDKNLADGWNLDDEAYNDDVLLGTIPAGERAEVFGVEMQSLTFSEAIVLSTADLAMDRTNVTTFDDTEERFYTALELRNAAPYDEDLSYRSWRIRILDPGDPTRERTLTFYDLAVNGSNTVVAGNQFTIGSRSGTDTNPGGAGGPRPSDFRVNYDYDTEMGGITFNTVIPYSARATAIVDGADDATSGYDLDLVRHDGTGKFDLGGFPTGGFISAAGLNVTFVIERRANLFRNFGATTADNPWVEVDRMVVPVRNFSQTASSTGMELVDTILPALTSRERPEALLASKEGVCTQNAAPYPQLKNTIGDVKNSNANDPFRFWQAHFDRPYTSPLDVLSLPICRPANITTAIGDGVNWGANPDFAQEKFLRPIHPANVPVITNGDLNNRWHRLLDFLAVPNRTQTSVTSLPAALRTPGLINLNTIRHRGVFAGLVDDYSLQFGPGDTNATTPTTFTGHFGGFASTNLRSMTVDTLADATDAVSRDWFGEFQKSRDQRDPITGLYLPGMAHSRPFRSLNFADVSASADHTILRSLPKDGGGVSRRGLFEASRNFNDTSLDTVVDQHTRHRLLRKVANNSTTRSNVFVVWVSVGFFEAIQHADGDVQVGGPLSGDGTPTHRGFFVIDRSLPETALDLTNGRFDFKRFIPFRKTIR